MTWWRDYKKYVKIVVITNMIFSEIRKKILVQLYKKNYKKSYKLYILPIIFTPLLWHALSLFWFSLTRSTFRFITQLSLYGVTFMVKVAVQSNHPISKCQRRSGKRFKIPKVNSDTKIKATKNTMSDFHDFGLTW